MHERIRHHFTDLKYAPRKLVSPKLGPQQMVLLGEVKETVEAMAVWRRWVTGMSPSVYGHLV